MTPAKAFALVFSLIVLSGINACGKDEIRTTCDDEDPEPYQMAVAGKRIVVPEGLDPLDELKEMTVPKSDSPPRAPGSKCIEYPPSIN